MSIPFRITKQEHVPFFIGERVVEYGELKRYIFNVVYKEEDHYRWAYFNKENNMMHPTDTFTDVNDATRHLMYLFTKDTPLMYVKLSDINVDDINIKSKIAMTDVTVDKRILKKYSRFCLTITEKDVTPRERYRHIIAIDYEKTNKRFDTFAKGIAKSHIYVKRNPGSIVAIDDYLFMNKNGEIKIANADRLEKMV